MCFLIWFKDWRWYGVDSSNSNNIQTTEVEPVMTKITLPKKVDEKSEMEAIRGLIQMACMVGNGMREDAGNEAMKLSQAALNAAHALSVIQNIEMAYELGRK